MNTQTQINHTPGPWITFIRTFGPEVITDNEAGKRLASLHWATCRDIDENESIANARLIAAAPELLEACKLALGQLEGVNPTSGVHSSSLSADIRIIKEAISKAEGKNK